MSTTKKILLKRDITTRFYWIVIERTEPKLASAQLPIFYLKKTAKNWAAVYGGKIVRVKCQWEN